MFKCFSHLTYPCYTHCFFNIRRFGVWDPRFESWIQQRKRSCLPSIRKLPAYTRASKLTTTNTYIARTRCKGQPAMGSSGLNACWSKGRAVEFKCLAWSSIAQSVCQWALSLLTIWCLRPWVRILHSAETVTCLPSIRKSLACARASK